MGPLRSRRGLAEQPSDLLLAVHKEEARDEDGCDSANGQSG